MAGLWRGLQSDLSPPMPRMIAPCFFIVSYCGGRGPSKSVVSAPCCASPPLSAKVPAFPFAIAVTKSATIGTFDSCTLSWPAHSPFSRSAITHGPVSPWPCCHPLDEPQ